VIYFSDSPRLLHGTEKRPPSFFSGAEVVPPGTMEYLIHERRGLRSLIDFCAAIPAVLPGRLLISLAIHSPLGV